MWQLWTVEGLEAGGNGWIEAPLLMLWREPSELHWGCSLEGPGGIESQLSTANSLTTHPCIAFSSFQALSPCSSVFFPGTTAQNELSHASLCMKL